MGYNRRSCIIWTVDRDTLQRYLDESKTMKEVIVDKLGMKMTGPQGVQYKRLKERIFEEGLDMTKFNYNRKQFRPTILRGKLVKIDIQTYFTENSTRDRGSIKKQIMKRKLIPYECQLCHLQPLWNAKELSLELDHINQINNDNRLENLRFLCPNCHSQVTNEYRNSQRKTKKDLCKCGKSKNRQATQCKKCSSGQTALLRRHFNPSREELEKVLLQHHYNMRACGRHYGVSDNAIRKRCRREGIQLK